MKATSSPAVVSLSMKYDANGKPNYTVMVSPGEKAPDAFVPAHIVYSTGSLEDGIKQFRILSALEIHLAKRKVQEWVPENPSVGQDPISVREAENQLNHLRTLEFFMRRSGLIPDEGTTETKPV